MKLQHIAAKGIAGVATIATIGAITSAPTHALTLVQWQFTSDNSPVVNTGVTATGVFPLGSGSANFGDVMNYIAPNGFTGNSSTSQAAALTSFAAINFGVGPSEGNVLNLNLLTFNVRNSFFPGGQIFLRSERDGYASDIGAIQSIAQVGTSGFSTVTFNLTAPTFQNLTDTTVFRLYVFNPDTRVGANSYDFDNLTMDGTVAASPVPFPFAPLPGIVLAWGAGKVRRKFQAKQLSARSTVSA